MPDAREPRLVTSATGLRDMTGNIQLYLTGVGDARGVSLTGSARAECGRGDGLRERVVMGRPARTVLFYEPENTVRLNSANSIFAC